LGSNLELPHVLENLKVVGGKNEKSPPNVCKVTKINRGFSYDYQDSTEVLCRLTK